MPPSSKRRSIGLGTSLTVIVCALGAGLVGFGAAGVASSGADRASAIHSAHLSRVGRDLFNALQDVRVERGSMRVALEAAQAIDGSRMDKIEAARSRSGTALAAVLEACADKACADNDSFDRLAAQVKTLENSRATVDPQLSRALGARTEADAKTFVSDIGAVIDSLEDASRQLTVELAKVDAFTSVQTGIKDSAYGARDGIGMQKYPVLDVVKAGTLSTASAVKIAQLQGQVAANWTRVETLAGRADTPEAVASAVAAGKRIYFDEIVKTAERIQAAAAAGEPMPEGAAGFDGEIDRATAQFAAISIAALDAIVARTDDHAASATQSLILNSLLLVGVLGICAGAIAFIRRRMVRSLAGITGAMLKVAEGDLSQEVPFTGRGDEIGRLAGALAVFKSNAEDNRRLEAEQRLEQQRRQQRQEEVEAAVTHFDGAVREVLESFDSSAGRMSSASQALTERSASSQARAAIVASASEETSASVQTVAAAAEELAASIAEIGRQVTHAASRARAVSEDAEATAAHVGGLDEAVQRIGTVIGLIQEIANRTNLLALNATIEAARAGEAGKGFAIVAHEVKGLAAQTGKATEEIATQIAAIQGATRQVVDSIEGIAGAVGEIDRTSAAIASAVEEQSAATREITRNTHEAASGTQEVSANIQAVTEDAARTGDAAGEVDAAGTALRDRAAVLTQEIDSFLARIRAA